MIKNRMSEKKYRDAEWLREQYVEKRRSTLEIASECGCDAQTVSNWLDRHGIEKRPPNPQLDERLEDGQWLREQYVEKNRSTREIATECECNRTTVGRWLDRHGIETRSPKSKLERLKDGQWLREQYVEKKRSTHEIAAECGCSDSTVSTWLERHGIEARYGGPQVDERLKDKDWLHRQYVEKKRTTYEIAAECGCNQKTVSSWLDRHAIETRSLNPELSPRLDSEDWLREQYVEKKRSTPEIAVECGCGTTTVSKYLRQHGIETRDGGQTGPGHYKWKGGTVPYGPGWTPSKRRSVRKRDDHRCVDCGMKQAEHKAEHDQKLHVHHLIKARDINDPEERNAMQNLITLCRTCHQRWEQIADCGIKPEVARCD